MSDFTTYTVSSDDIQNNPLLTVFGVNAGDTLEYKVIPAVAEGADVEESTTENDSAEKNDDVDTSSTDGAETEA